jgi:hypothetical protein
MEEIKKILETLRNQMDEVWEEYNTKLETTLASLKASLNNIPKPPAVPFDLDQAASLLSNLSQPAAAAPSSMEGDPVPPLQESLHRIDSGKTQVEILDVFLEEASKQAGRVALFIYKGEQVMGWKGMGFTRMGSDDARVKSIALPLSEGNPLHGVFQSKHSHLYQPLVEDMICKGIEGPSPDKIFLVPMIIRDKVSAALYADEVKGATPLHPDALEILTWAASLAVNLLGQRQLVPCPTLTPGTVKIEGTRPTPSIPAAAPPPLVPSAPPSQVPTSERTQKIDVTAMQELEALRRETLKKPAPHVEPKPVPEPPRVEPPPPPRVETMPTAPKPPAYEMEYAPEPSMDATAISAPEEYSAPEAPPVTEWAQVESEPEPAPPPPPAPAPAFIPEPPRAPAPRSATTTFIPQPPTPFAPVIPIPKPAAATAPMPKLEEESPKKSVEVKPPPGFKKDRPGFGFESFQPQPGMSVEESRRHDEARRFARLLVSEIKLYNEPKVEEGRRNKSIYSLLKEDIDRSKQIYEERIAADIRSKSDFFRQALVSILANGDASALGTDS